MQAYLSSLSLSRNCCSLEFQLLIKSDVLGQKIILAGMNLKKFFPELSAKIIIIATQYNSLLEQNLTNQSFEVDLKRLHEQSFPQTRSCYFLILKMIHFLHLKCHKNAISVLILHSLVHQLHLQEIVLALHKSLMPFNFSFFVIS